LNRPCLRTYDKKERRYRISFAEKQIKELRLKYPDDKLYELVLTYRSLDKLAGTYIGRPINA
jgi:DNA polymerase I-like protein with 3'-5' exonuclease and polymerase domains